MTQIKKQKLELTWIGKEKRPRLEPRIFLEDKELSCLGEQKQGVFNDNLLIHSDNLLALKALEQEYTGQVQCIYIDPPFNTGEAFENYDDGVEHSIWLSLMKQRLEILHSLLTKEGSLFVHIDDNELGYLLVLCDEIFGRENRRSIISFKQSSVSGPKAQNPGLVTTTNYIIWYAKDRKHWFSRKCYKETKRDSRYSKYIVNYDEHFNDWKLENVNTVFAQKHGVTSRELKKTFGDSLEKELEAFVLQEPERVVRTARVKEKDVNEAAREALRLSSERDGVFRAEREGKSDYYFMNGEQLLFYSNKTKKIDGRNITGEALSNSWDDLLSNNLHKEGGVTFPKGKKPEALIRRILELSSSEGDLILDSFAGSGSTAAVAHKMKRRWITIELGEQAFTHVQPRMKRVVLGTDKDGISKAVNWQGGGGFRYLRLAPSLLQKDEWGNWIINKEYNAEMLSAAMCKHMGFTYAPSETQFWNHGYSTETDFIYVTTGALAYDQLKRISEEVGEDRTLLICCKAFMSEGSDFSNLTIKKIPQSILNKCEWDNDDYSFTLNVLAEPEEYDLDDEDDQ
ncbi:site-specific DNA-methyltransferase [Shewanella marisflavi]|uniref:site-specific DNA-methyltransferase n=1 Tax=Shewanella marisflavi TaxID=260364 RepID=UPI002B3A9813|nr:site-specific DNA-methyltransferase [Vibrio harveyi]HEQ3597358.1 site-specific DNA-methyltransferase [Vibrio harveyi]HEQ3609771.1 site-specific DNA-methyltransferase [Vibrio harveyi]